MRRYRRGRHSRRGYGRRRRRMGRRGFGRLRIGYRM